ncbi:MAG: GxxExxY protein [Planctomycetaceae bacterium]
MQFEDLTYSIRGAATDVHRELGPGLLESTYEECLCCELSQRRLKFQRQVTLPVVYKHLRLDCGYRLDVVVESTVVLEIKSVESLSPLHDAQLLTYLRIGRYPVGLLINFNTPVLKDGIRRFVC